MRDRVEAGEGGSFEQCVITATERDDVKDQLFASEVVRQTTSSVTEPVQRASTPCITPLKVVLVGLILDESMPMLRTMS